MKKLKRHMLSGQEYIRAIAAFAKKNAKKWDAAVAEHNKAFEDWRRMLDAEDWKGVRKARFRMSKAAGKMQQIHFDMTNLDAYGEPMRLQVVPFGGGVQ